jgi:RHS repeat-associated protein
MTSGPDFTNLASIQTRTSITYNADNMPTQIVHSSNGTTELTYGGTGERVKKRVYSGGTVTDTYYIGDHFEVKGGETIKYIFAGNLRVAQVKGTTRSFFHKDHLGSSTVMTDASGYELEYSDYAPFGSQRAHTGTSTSDYRYTDQELDAENGLYNYNARLYDPFIGRFISADTIIPEPFNPQSLNRYPYCLNNPLIYVDPSGHAQKKKKDEEEEDAWVMDEIVVTGSRVYYCTNGFGGVAWLTRDEIMSYRGVWYILDPILGDTELNNEYQKRFERYLSSTAPQGGNSNVYRNPKLDKLKLTNQQKTFFNDIVPIIKEGTSGTGVLPSVAIGQAALESGWGENAHLTLYGIKGAGNSLETKEFIDGKWITITDSFKASNSIGQSVNQYVNLLTTNSRYAAALKTSDPYVQINEIKSAGYATDPNYVKNVSSIIRKYNLPFYDR